MYGFISRVTEPDGKDSNSYNIIQYYNPLVVRSLQKIKIGFWACVFSTYREIKGIP